MAQQQRAFDFWLRPGQGRIYLDPLSLSIKSPLPNLLLHLHFQISLNRVYDRERETERELWKKNDEGGGKKRKRGLNSNVDAFDASAVERTDRGENRQVWIRGGEGYAICKSLNVRIKYPSLSYPTRSFKSPLVEMRWAAGRLVVERLPSNATYRVIRQESEPRALIFARLSYL